ncbi:hypothetical protein L0B52_08220 [Suttonella sp. R2A3]|uniref:Trm112 family protein n=1 Tax=Suttonella sp. R2A3 TaxID=2908648 RepID=UPI001F27B4CD|nr:hypothetical protein [Suttonella sp. R2A3]UJF24308.1 hypothetical protein L0B52_08220 [Suttonella sp. R2A3]
MNKQLLATLRCPITGQSLVQRDAEPDFLYTADGAYRYPLENGIALLLAEYGEALSSQES